ncbi:MAG: transposase [Planctomycetales bacterium]|nr:transposase [Planctomycetales bacterium]MCA9225136.1 transposase [Planctomycetales bacterium]
MMPTFTPFNPEGPLRIYYRNLPHWRQPGATYFVTFRQADSIPKAVIAEWQDIRDRWLKAHQLNPQWLQSNPERLAAELRKIAPAVRMAFEREQARLLHEELDRSHGSCVLRLAYPQHELAKSLMHFDGNRLAVGDWILMPNHVHAIVQPFGEYELEDILGSIKQWSSRLIREWLKRQPADIQPQGPDYSRERFWQQESYDRIIRDMEELVRFRKYIADNAKMASVPTGQFRHYAADWLDSSGPYPTS